MSSRVRPNFVQCLVIFICMRWELSASYRNIRSRMVHDRLQLRNVIAVEIDSCFLIHSSENTSGSPT
jgi:hypothetical protein